MSALARALTQAADPELQAGLARDALAGLDRLLKHIPRGEALPAEEVGALVRLVVQAEHMGRAAVV